MDKFVSYAQNLEDVLLWRALQDVPNGFYVDIGANHPVCDSVTKAFYDRGWRGINVEPVHALCDQLVADRPRDINLCVAIAAEKGTQPFFEILCSGLSTLDDGVAQQHAAAGYEVRRHSVPVSTIAEVCDTHGVSEVHFLKIDVEGAEAAVLRGMPFDRLRPWLIVVEATRPNSTTQTHLEWESLILPHGYAQVYFDGVNRYYLSDEHRELSGAFLAPPNVFDDYIRYPYKLALEDLAAHRSLLAEMQESWSWRLTKPLRQVRALLQSILGAGRGSTHD
jgi:FkbM family methyltransferase